MRVSGAALGISGGEDGVDEDEGTDDLGAETVTLGVTAVDVVGATAVGHEDILLEALDNTSTADGTKALHHDVVHCPRQRQLPRQEQSERHGWVNVTSCRIKQFLSFQTVIKVNKPV